MYQRMIFNDIKKNRLVSAAACIFMAVSAALIGLTVLLFASLLNSIDNLMTYAKTCDFLQMHAGDLDMDELTAFAASRDDVEDMLVANFLNVENSALSLNGRLLTDSTQDNGFCIQNDNFDHLLGMNNEIIYPEEGKVYVPICYKSEYDLEEGQIMKAGDMELVIEGFLRDSQMNSMMASSKRFLVNPSDYKKLEGIGSAEYLIEFLIKDGHDINEFATAYSDAGLPSNGPTITSSLIKMMNALSDGMMILVILLVSIVVLIISLICIRYIVLTGLEKDKKEAGMLKAVGIPAKAIRKIYIRKYILLSWAGGLIGGLAALLLSKPLGRQMTELYGPADNMTGIILVSVLGIVLTEVIILSSVKKHLKKYDRLSAVEAIRDDGRTGKRKTDSFFWIGAITVASVFLMLVPINMATTISSDKFVSYMGVGLSQVRIDVAQCDSIEDVSRDFYKKIEADSRVDRFALMQTRNYKATYNNTKFNLLTETGDHTAFPLSYIEGAQPTKNGEIALSMLQAQDIGCKVGDTISLYIDDSEIPYTVCGIYSDITNGGKTAKISADTISQNDDNALSKASLRDMDSPLMWSIIYITLKDGEDVQEFIADYKTYSDRFDGTVKITDIARYIEGTYGQTIQRIKMAACTSVFTAGLIIFIVILLFVRLKIWQEKKDIILKKALGLSVTDIRKDYIKRAFPYIIAGIAIGIIMGIFIGQILAGMVLASLGAGGFRFVINWIFVFILVPFISVVVAYIAVNTATREVKMTKIEI